MELLKARKKLGISTTDHKGILGIEVEAEFGEGIERVETEHWTTKTDRSLRYHGYEFVSPRPLLLEEVPSAMNFICKRLRKMGVMEDSPRTSVHVHRNMNNYSLVQVWQTCVVYWLLEESLFKMCGPSREQNLFCLRLKDAIGTRQTLIRDIKDNEYGQPLRYLYRADNIRYSGLNLCALPMFGSLEFRGMEGGSYEEDRLVSWILLLNYIIEASVKEFTSPRDVMAKLYDNGIEWFVNTVLGPYKEVVVKHDPNLLTSVKKAIPLVLEVAYLVDWDEYLKKLVAKPKFTASTTSGDAPLNLATANIVRAMERQVQARPRAMRAVDVNNPIVQMFDDVPEGDGV